MNKLAIKAYWKAYHLWGDVPHVQRCILKKLIKLHKEDESNEKKGLACAK